MSRPEGSPLFDNQFTTAAHPETVSDTSALPLSQHKEDPLGQRLIEEVNAISGAPQLTQPPEQIEVFSWTAIEPIEGATLSRRVRNVFRGTREQYLDHRRSASENS